MKRKSSVKERELYAAKKAAARAHGWWRRRGKGSGPVRAWTAQHREGMFEKLMNDERSRGRR